MTYARFKLPGDLGRKMGDERLKAFADRHGRWLTFSWKALDHAKQWFNPYGGMTVLLCRLVPGIRSLISIPAGIKGMPLIPFLLSRARDLMTALPLLGSMPEPIL